MTHTQVTCHKQHTFSCVLLHLEVLRRHCVQRLLARLHERCYKITVGERCYKITVGGELHERCYKITVGEKVLACLHDVGQGGVAGLVQAKVWGMRVT